MDILDLIDVRRIYLTRLVSAFLPLYQRPDNCSKQLHERFPWLVSGFWRMTESIIKFQYPLKACDTIADEPIEIDIFNLDFLPRKEVYQLDAPRQNPKPAHHYQRIQGRRYRA